MKFSEQLKELRRINKVSQEYVGSIIDLERQQISNYESGKSVPNALHLEKLADHFHVSVDWLLGRPENDKVIPISERQEEENTNPTEKFGVISQLMDFLYADYIEMKKRFDKQNEELFKCKNKVIELLEQGRT